MNDYANKEWAGLISGFYHPRCCSCLTPTASVLHPTRFSVHQQGLCSVQCLDSVLSRLLDVWVYLQKQTVKLKVAPSCRWAMWLQRLEADLKDGRPYDAEAWRQQVCDEAVASPDVASLHCLLSTDHS